MNTDFIANAGIGKAQFSNKLMFTIDVVLFSATISVWVFFFLILGWAYFSSEQSYDLAKIDTIARFSNANEPKIWRMRDQNGRLSVVAATLSDGQMLYNMTPSEVKTALRRAYKPVEQFHIYFVSSIILSITSFFAVLVFMARRGKKSQEDVWLRGASPIVTSQELRKLVRRKDASPYEFATVPLPKSSVKTGILVSGAQGKGKSLLINDLMDQVLSRGKKAVIYDPSGEAYASYFRPGKDFFFNPACLGSVPWSIFSELKYKYDADTFAEAFLPSKHGVNPGAHNFFEDAARALFSVILLRLTELGSVNTADIAEAFFSLPKDQVEYLVRNSVADSAIGGDSKGQRQGVISSVSVYMNGIANVNHGSWTIRDFINADDDSRLFLYGTDDTTDMFIPIFRILISTAFSAIASKQEIIHGDAKYWFFLDELHTLDDIKVDKRLATLRKYGVAIIAGIQSESQFSELMGEKRAQTTLNCFNTVAQLGVNDVNMMESASKRLGAAEVNATTLNTALGVSKMRDGLGLSTSIQQRALVTPSEIKNLNDCVAYLKLPGDYPLAKIDFRNWLKKSIWGTRYVDKFAEKIPRPQRDPAYIIERELVDKPEAPSDMQDIIAKAMARMGKGYEKEALANNKTTEEEKNEDMALDSQAKIFFKN